MIERASGEEDYEYDDVCDDDKMMMAMWLMTLDSYDDDFDVAVDVLYFKHDGVDVDGSDAGEGIASDGYEEEEEHDYDEDVARRKWSIIIVAVLLTTPAMMETTRIGATT